MPSPFQPRAFNSSSSFLDRVEAALRSRLRDQRMAPRAAYLLDALLARVIPLSHISGRVNTHPTGPRPHVTATGFRVHLPADGALPDTGPGRFAEIGSSPPPAMPPSPAPSTGRISTIEQSGSNTSSRKRARSHSAASLPPNVVMNVTLEASPTAEDAKTDLKLPDVAISCDAEPASSSRRKRVRRESAPQIPGTRSSRPTRTSSQSVSKPLSLRSSPRIRRMSESKTSNQPKTERQTSTKYQPKR